MTALLPMMERFAPLAEHPAMEDLPQLLTIMHDDVMPILERLPGMVERTERLLAVADGAVTVLMLPLRTAVLVADLAVWRPLARVRSALVALATDPGAPGWSPPAPGDTAAAPLSAGLSEAAATGAAAERIPA